MHFRVGEEVVCINDQCGGHVNYGDARQRGVYKDSVYRIARIADNEFLHFETISGGWHHTRFRSMKNTVDITLFTLLLNVTKQKVSADAV